MKGATTILALDGTGVSENFNPRSREGSDLSSVKYWLARLISIHAPVKGATTILALDGTGVSENFNPRSREGSDARLDYAPVRVVKFQSTLP